ncbi:MAG: homoserine dehydrogenase [Ferruginibacter sp.]|nr:homoserine dehydrogenase [Ferruginibacter sp.]
MTTNNKLTIGLFGYGVVGKGLYSVLHNTPTLTSTIKKICIKDEQKQRDIDTTYFTANKNILLNDPEINVVVELIDDADAAFDIVKTALQNGKAVVSANKKMIAEHFVELLALQKENNVPFLYEASCCASMPIIRNLEEYYDNDLLNSFRGIINGSTNYILTKMLNENEEYKIALLNAQAAGFAESNPVLDVEGYDAVNKLSILLAHSFGVIAKPANILFTGIQNICNADARYATEKEQRIKLVANIKKLNNGKLAAYVLPQFVSNNDDLFFVQNEFNAAVTESTFADKHFFKGKGAGAYPTASAVLSDIGALRYNYKYEYKKLFSQNKTELTNDYYLRVFISTGSIEKVNKQNFEWIEEYHNTIGNCWLIGVIHAQKLVETNWWKQQGVSLVLCEDAIIENIDYKKINKRSLELAGVV